MRAWKEVYILQVMEWTLLVALYKVESALMCSIDFIAYSMQNQLESRSSIHLLSFPQSTAVLTCFDHLRNARKTKHHLLVDQINNVLSVTRKMFRGADGAKEEYS